MIRFAVASDLHWHGTSVTLTHWGDDPTMPDHWEYRFDCLVQWLRSEVCSEPGLDFLVLNGDIADVVTKAELAVDHQRGAERVRAARDSLARIGVTTYAVHGNHDHPDEAVWQEIWGHGHQHEWELGATAFLALKTTSASGEKGAPPDQELLQDRLEHYRNKQQVIVFMHDFACGIGSEGEKHPAISRLLESYPNVRLVFLGHLHRRDNLVYKNGIGYAWCGHNCGTAIPGKDWLPYGGYRIGQIHDDGRIQTYMWNGTAGCAVDAMEFHPSGEVVLPSSGAFPTLPEHSIAGRFS